MVAGGGQRRRRCRRGNIMGALALCRQGAEVPGRGQPSYGVSEERRTALRRLVLLFGMGQERMLGTGSVLAAAALEEIQAALAVDGRAKAAGGGVVPADAGGVAAVVAAPPTGDGR